MGDKEYKEICKRVPWYVRITFPDVVLPTVALGIVAYMIYRAFFR